MPIKINEDDLRLKLLAGLPVDIGHIGKLHFPSLHQIITINESTYNGILSHLLVDKSQIDQFKDQDITNLKLILNFCEKDPLFMENFLIGMNLLFQEDVNIHEKGFLFLGIDRGIHSDDFSYIQEVIRVAHWMKDDKEEEYKPANSKARELIEMMLKNKKKQPQKKSDTDLHSMISGLAWKSNNCNLNEIINLNMYQLHDAFHRFSNIENVHYTLHGIYAGTVDGKKIKQSDLNWAKILKVN